MLPRPNAACASGKKPPESQASTSTPAFSCFATSTPSLFITAFTNASGLASAVFPDLYVVKRFRKRSASVSISSATASAFIASSCPASAMTL